MTNKEDIAESIRQRSFIKDPNSNFYKTSGPKAAGVIRNLSEEYSGKDKPSVLDFGCASGRVLLPLAELAPGWLLHGCDVDKDAIEYVRLCNNKVTVAQNGYYPPAPYPDKFFDVVYSVSVWSHFPNKTALAWLEELHRVLKLSGVAIITTAGPTMLEYIKKTFRFWDDVTIEQLMSEGFVYRESGNLQSHKEQYPGIDASWGNTIVTEAYVRGNWATFFSVEKYLPKGMNGQQDIYVLKPRLS